MTVALLIVFVVALMVGPLMYIQPSKTDRLRSRVRLFALKRGLRVRLSSNPNDKKLGQVPVYSMPWDQVLEGKSIKIANSFDAVLKKQPFAHGLHLSGVWDWLDKGKKLDEKYCPILVAKLEQIPASVFAMEFNTLGFGCYVNEQSLDVSENFDELEQWMKEVMNSFFH